MHQLLAEKQIAPQLYGCQDLPGGWKMVAMEWLPNDDWVTLDLKKGNVTAYTEKILEALDLVWASKWVHGDIRPSNILVPTSGEIDFRLLDFDFSGKEDEDHYPRDWNNILRPVGAVGGAVLKVKHDKKMIEALRALDGLEGVLEVGLGSGLGSGLGLKRY
jgi:serine/threonine protein kinase